LLSRTIIFANGSLAHPRAARALIGPGDRLIAADGGAAHCLALGLTPHLVIGDFDSIAPADLDALQRAGAQLVRHPARKDQTDLELALETAIREGATDVTILGGLGGRWDQTLANLLLPTLPWLAQARVEIADGRQTIRYLRGPGQMALSGHSGDTLSLSALGAGAQGITTTGLEYPLTGGSLQPGSTLGISNTFTGPQATITLDSGLLIILSFEF
jgi:thiamine pyrophosphokinase